MSRSLIRKELMEASAVAALAAAVYLLMLVAEVYDSNYQANAFHRASLLSYDIIQYCLLFPATFAGLLGLGQTVSESVQGTWGYLLHLPPPRRDVVRIKLYCGIASYLLCSGLFLGICLLIALSRQSVIRPVEWWMFSPYVQCIVSGLLIYLGAFLTGLRPARWYGSKLFPLSGVVALWWVLLFVPQWWLYGLLSLLVMCVVLIAMIFHVAETRDYV